MISIIKKYFFNFVGKTKIDKYRVENKKKLFKEKISHHLDIISKIFIEGFNRPRH